VNKVSTTRVYCTRCSPDGAVAGIEVVLLVEVEIVDVDVNSKPSGSLQRLPSQQLLLQLSIAISNPNGASSLNKLSHNNELQLLNGMHLHKDADPETKYMS